MRLKKNDNYEGLFEDCDSKIIIITKCKYLIPELEKLIKIMGQSNDNFLSINPIELENLHCMGLIHLLEYKINELSEILDKVLMYLEESQILLDNERQKCKNMIENSKCSVCKQNIILNIPELHFIRTFMTNRLDYFWNSDMLCDTCFNKIKLRSEIRIYKESYELSDTTNFYKYMINRIKSKDLLGFENE
jgi:hypothetical protein